MKFCRLFVFMLVGLMLSGCIPKSSRDDNCYEASRSFDEPIELTTAYVAHALIKLGYSNVKLDHKNATVTAEKSGAYPYEDGSACNHYVDKVVAYVWEPGSYFWEPDPPLAVVRLRLKRFAMECKLQGRRRQLQPCVYDEIFSVIDYLIERSYRDV